MEATGKKKDKKVSFLSGPLQKNSQEDFQKEEAKVAMEDTPTQMDMLGNLRSLMEDTAVDDGGGQPRGAELNADFDFKDL